MELLAVVERGQYCYFHLAYRTATGSQDTQFTPTFFDVLRNSTGEVVIPDSPFQVSQIYNGAIVYGIIDTSLAAFVPGEQYTIVVKLQEGTEVTTFQTYGLSILGPLTSRLQTITDRLVYIRNDIENVLFTRTHRMLASLGENLLLDQFTYDPAGNVQGLRVRYFDTKANCNAATGDIEDEVLPEIGEIMTLLVTQENDRPRCVRTLHRSVPVVEAGDAGVNANTSETQVFAPGNEGGWPT
jgi:hypothetical protein